MKLLVLLLLFVSSAFSLDAKHPMVAMLASATVFDVAPTGSMEPTFDQRSWVLVAAVPWEDVRIGDVVVYASACEIEGTTYSFIIHRVVYISPDGLWMLVKGDANVSIDVTRMTNANYLGTVVAIVRRPEWALNPEDVPAK